MINVLDEWDKNGVGHQSFVESPRHYQFLIFSWKGGVSNRFVAFVRQKFGMMKMVPCLCLHC
jgi:hypothetical protein